jgi:hemin uptake protein HemP
LNREYVGENMNENEEIHHVKRIIPKIRSEDLLKGGNEIVILHGEEEYRLRLTKNDRLLLTK